MKSKKTLFRVVLMLMLASVSCTDFIASVEKHTDWDVFEHGRVTLYVRPAGYTQTASPDDAAIDRILENQNFYYSNINEFLGLNYSERVHIYLFNLDEAYFSIGTQNGGHAVSDRSTIYYSYIRPSFQDNFGRTAFIGAHEMVHVITHNALGKPFTKMMSEGYAVAIDGAYGRREAAAGVVVGRSVMEWMVQHYQAGNVMSPEELLAMRDEADAIYYPNAGFFVRYLWDRFGVETINKLFNEGEENFRVRFLQETGVSWTQVSQEYTVYYEDILGSAD